MQVFTTKAIALYLISGALLASAFFLPTARDENSPVRPLFKIIVAEQLKTKQLRGNSI